VSSEREKLEASRQRMVGVCTAGAPLPPSGALPQAARVVPATAPIVAFLINERRSIVTSLVGEVKGVTIFTVHRIYGPSWYRLFVTFAARCAASNNNKRLNLYQLDLASASAG
jgi:hypothetical protein